MAVRVLGVDRRKVAAAPAEKAEAAFEALWGTLEGRRRLAWVTAKFLRRHFYRNPYPPILVWPEASVRSIRAAWRALARRRTSGAGPVGLYLHLPFCETKCQFCNCMSITDVRARSHDGYLDLLEKEIALTRFPRSLPIRTLYLGGGTPNLMGPAQLSRLFRMLEESFDLSKTIERTVEVSPFAPHEPTIRTLADNGINRVTVGVQTINAELLRRMRRPQTRETVRETCGQLRRHGVRDIHIDLLAGLPGETMDSFLESLDFALSLKPSNVSVYPFANILTTPYHLEGGTYGPVDVALREEMLRRAEEILGKAYPPEAAKSPVESRQRLDRDHRDGSVLGLGYSARSYVKGILSYHKVNEYGRYMSRLSRGEYPEARGWSVESKDAMRAYVIDRLEFAARLSKTEFAGIYGRSPEAIFAEEAGLARRLGLLRDAGDDWIVPEHARDHETNRLMCGKMFYSKDAMKKVWMLMASGDLA